MSGFKLSLKIAVPHKIAKNMALRSRSSVACGLQMYCQEGTNDTRKHKGHENILYVIDPLTKFGATLVNWIASYETFETVLDSMVGMISGQIVQMNISFISRSILNFSFPRFLTFLVKLSFNSL